MIAPETEIPIRTEQGELFIATKVMLGVSGAVLGGVAAGTFFGEAADPALVAQRQEFLDQANDLRAAVTKKEAALDLLDDVKPATDSMIITLGREIRADHSQIETFTSTANNLHSEASMDPVGAGIGAAIGAIAFIAGMRLKRPFNRALSRILYPKNKVE